MIHRHTNEFAWIPNTDLAPITPEDCAEVSEKSKTRALIEAYKTASEDHDLAHYRTLLEDHEKAIAEDEEQRAEAEAEKAAKKAAKAKRKSEATVADDADEMEVDDDDAERKPKSKKRKKELDSDAGDEKVCIKEEPQQSDCLCLTAC